MTLIRAPPHRWGGGSPTHLNARIAKYRSTSLSRTVLRPTTPGQSSRSTGGFLTPRSTATEIGKKGLLKHFPAAEGAELAVMKAGAVIDLRGKILLAVEAALLHWPDSMETFLPEQGSLFSNDAFIQHLCLSKRFDTDLAARC